MSQNSSNNPKRAFTLTEIAAVLSVVGVILALVWGVASNASESRKDNDAATELNIVATSIINMMQGRNFNLSTNPVGCPAAGGYPTKLITGEMIAAQAIPASYVNPATPCVADNPWTSGNFAVTAKAARVFRLSFYQVSMQGCVALLTAATACQSNQSACPTLAVTDMGATTCKPGVTGQAGCPTALATAVDWQVLSSTAIVAMCAANSYTGGANSVEFEYSL